MSILDRTVPPASKLPEPARLTSFRTRRQDTLRRVGFPPHAVTLLGLLLASGCTSQGAEGPPPGKPSGTALTLVVGSRQPARAYGVAALRLDPGSGTLEFVDNLDGLESPTFVAATDDPELFVVASEVSAGKGGAIATLRLRDGTLERLGTMGSGGLGPCHLGFEAKTRTVYAAHYSDGIVSALPIDGDGLPGARLASVAGSGSGPVAKRQDGPHAHAAVPSPDGRWLLTADLGTDRVDVYRINPRNGSIGEPPTSTLRLPGGTGPRHLAFAPGGDRVGITGELAGTVTIARFDPTAGTLDILGASPTFSNPPKVPNYVSTLRFAADGRTLYVGNRGDDSIAQLRIDAATGLPTLVTTWPTGGLFPWDFALTPDGRWMVVANYGSDEVRVLRVDATSGALTITGTNWPIAKPTSVTIRP